MSSETASENPPPIARAVALFASQQAFADALGVHQTFVSRMVVTGRVPAERCRQIEEVTGGAVTRYELRPDVFGDNKVA